MSFFSDPCEHLYIGGCPHCARPPLPLTRRTSEMINALDLSQGLIDKLVRQKHAREESDMLTWLRKLLLEATR